jgi:hypothetical protein
VLRRSEQTRFSSPNDDEVGALQGAIRAERAKRAEQSNRIAPRAVLRRSEGTCFSSASDDEVGALQGAIRARDVRAADLQEEPTKRVETEPILRHGRFVGSNEDGGSPANIAASGASH